jgi:hypothetical protein
MFLMIWKIQNNGEKRIRNVITSEALVVMMETIDIRPAQRFVVWTGSRGSNRSPSMFGKYKAFFTGGERHKNE